jgi:hypothetical protein
MRYLDLQLHDDGNGPASSSHTVETQYLRTPLIWNRKAVMEFRNRCWKSARRLSHRQSEGCAALVKLALPFGPLGACSHDLPRAPS